MIAKHIHLRNHNGRLRLSKLKNARQHISKKISFKSIIRRSDNKRGQSERQRDNDDIGEAAPQHSMKMHVEPTGSERRRGLRIVQRDQ